MIITQTSRMQSMQTQLLMNRTGFGLSILVLQHRIWIVCVFIWLISKLITSQLWSNEHISYYLMVENEMVVNKSRKKNRIIFPTILTANQCCSIVLPARWSSNHNWFLNVYLWFNVPAVVSHEIDDFHFEMQLNSSQRKLKVNCSDVNRFVDLI